MGSDYADHPYEWLAREFFKVFTHSQFQDAKYGVSRGMDLHGFPEVHYRSQDLLSDSGVFNLILLTFLWAQSSPVQSSPVQSSPVQFSLVQFSSVQWLVAPFAV